MQKDKDKLLKLQENQLTEKYDQEIRNIMQNEHQKLSTLRKELENQIDDLKIVNQKRTAKYLSQQTNFILAKKKNQKGIEEKEKAISEKEKNEDLLKNQINNLNTNLEKQQQSQNNLKNEIESLDIAKKELEDRLQENHQMNELLEQKNIEDKDKLNNKQFIMSIAKLQYNIKDRISKDEIDRKQTELLKQREDYIKKIEQAEKEKKEMEEKMILYKEKMRKQEKEMEQEKIKLVEYKNQLESEKEDAVEDKLTEQKVEEDKKRVEEEIKKKKQFDRILSRLAGHLKVNSPSNKTIKETNEEHEDENIINMDDSKLNDSFRQKNKEYEQIEKDYPNIKINAVIENESFCMPNSTITENEDNENNNFEIMEGDFQSISKIMDPIIKLNEIQFIKFTQKQFLVKNRIKISIGISKLRINNSQQKSIQSSIIQF